MEVIRKKHLNYISTYWKKNRIETIRETSTHFSREPLAKKPDNYVIKILIRIELFMHYYLNEAPRIERIVVVITPMHVITF